MTNLEYWNNRINGDLINEWNDTHIPKGRVAHHDTGKPKKYWLAVDDYSEILTNYSSFVNQSLQLKEIGGNQPPTFSTTDPAKIKDLAKRTIKKWPDKYVFVGVDDSSHGVMTGKDHLRASVRYIWNPNYKMWNDADMDEAEHEKLEESLNKNEIVERVIENLIYFASGKSNEIFNDDEWFNDVKNCIKDAITLKLYKPNTETSELIKQLTTTQD